MHMPAFYPYYLIKSFVIHSYNDFRAELQLFIIIISLPFYSSIHLSQFVMVLSTHQTKNNKRKHIMNNQHVGRKNKISDNAFIIIVRIHGQLKVISIMTLIALWKQSHCHQYINQSSSTIGHSFISILFFVSNFFHFRC